MSERERPGTRWREHVELVVMSLAAVLLLKVFVFEVSRIPSGSMQPTLMGDPGARVFDRLAVDKLSYALRDPRRWEVVVFRHPLERSRNMVKRLVGMPGESFKVEKGDLWTRPLDAGADAPWTLLRRPRSVLTAHLRELAPLRSGGSGWAAKDGPLATGPGSIRATGPGVARFRDGSRTVRDGYTDGYPEAIRSQVYVPPAATMENPVGDLRVEGRVRAQASLTSLRVVLTEGARTYELLLPGPAAGVDARPGVRVLVDAAEQVAGASDAARRLPADAWVSFAAENLDDRLAIELDGERVCELDVEPVEDQRSTVSVVLEGGGAELEELRVLRDVYYLPGKAGGTPIDIPEGHYLMLGDNTQDSADSRDWTATRYLWTDDSGERLDRRGNFRPGENPLTAQGGLAPGDQPVLQFRDEWGEIHHIAPQTATQKTPRSAPLVPRGLIRGRGFAVFWPIQPWRGVWRLRWVR